jgi:hypothetical protein
MVVVIPKKDPRDIAAEKEVMRLVDEYPDKLDFYDVVNMVPKRSSVYKMEAKRALVSMINNGILRESANRTIKIAEIINETRKT